MPGLTGPDTSSLYPQAPTPPQPINQLTQMGNMVDVQNALQQQQILQQQVQQQRFETARQNAEIKAKAMIPKYMTPAGLDTNAWISDMAKDPETALYVPQAISTGMDINEATPTGAVDAQGKPIAAAGQSVSAKYSPKSGQGNGNETIPPAANQNQPAEGAPPSAAASNPAGLPEGASSQATGTPVGFSTALPTSRANYDKVSADASNAPGQNAAYNEVINLANAGVMSGTNLTRAYAAAARNDPFHIMTGATDATVMNQELQKWMSQGLLAAGMPGSDARLDELQHGNLNPEQLTQTLKEMAPFFKAVSEGTQRKQDYYNKVTDNGTNLAAEPAAKAQWDDNYDPRWVEYADLKNKTDKHAFLVKHPDLLDKQSNYQKLQHMGVVGGQ